MEESLRRAKRVKREVETRWLALAGVVAVGIGQGAGGAPAIVVSIDADDERTRRAIPTSVQGVPVEVRVSGPIRPL